VVDFTGLVIVIIIAIGGVDLGKTTTAEADRCRLVEEVAFFEEARWEGGHSDRQGKKRVEEPTHSREKVKALGKEDMMRERVAVKVVRAEQEQKKEMEKIRLGACLGRMEYRRAWEEIGGLEILKRGVQLRWNWKGAPVDRGVKRATVKNAKEKAAYKQQLQEMIDEGIIVEKKEEMIKFFNHTFLLKKTETEYRFILNAKKLNQYLIVRHFKLESIGTILDTLKPGDLMVKFDLKSAYSQVPLAATATDYLGFEYEGRTFVYQALPFGLATAPCLFTKIMKPVITKLRQKHRCGIYLDDGIMMFATAEEAEEGIEELIRLLVRLGLRISWKKSELVPTRSLEFLGWGINTEKMEISVLERKKTEAERRLKAWIKRAEEKRTVRIRNFASIVGMLASMSLIVQQAHLRLRLCNQEIETAAQSQGWDGKMQLNEKVIPGLRWFQEKLKRETVMRIRPFIPCMEITTDASGTGWGAEVNGKDGKRRLGGVWGADMADPKTSSNMRELTAVREAVGQIVEGGMMGTECDILVRSDNLTTVANINRRSCAPTLLPEMLRLFDVLEGAGLRIRTTYIPGKENVVADELSRQVDSTDYSMDTDVFMSLTEDLEVSVGIDLFASPGNAKARRFYSWRPARGALATDALVQSWHNEEDMYAFPPTVLIPKILCKLRHEKGRMLIITPAWESAAWMKELEDMTVRRRDLGEIGEFATRGAWVPRNNKDPPGSWMASVIQA
jgi:hypothetical protein